MLLFDKYKNLVSRLQENICKIIVIMEEIAHVKWESFFTTTYQLLEAWFAKQYGLYTRSSRYAKAAMKNYFMPNINSSIYQRMLRRDINLFYECNRAMRQVTPSYNFTTLSLGQLTAFKNKLQSFHRKSRLDGTFFQV